MVYRALGIMSGSSLDGLDMAFVEFQKVSGKWSYSVKATACYPYTKEWLAKLQTATTLPARDYQLLNTAYGNYIGEQVNHFIQENMVQYQVQLISSHGHTTFHIPSQRMTAQIGDGAAIAALTGINVVSDLRSMDIALGGQGAPIISIGEKLLWPEYSLLLNIGGIANISLNIDSTNIAFDICPANRVLNLLANEVGKSYDEKGALAAIGTVQEELLNKLNALDYYKQPYPKSLSNDFGTEIVWKLIKEEGYQKRDSVSWVQDALRTYVEHIGIQIENSIQQVVNKQNPQTKNCKLLVTGGGAHNAFLIDRIKALIGQQGIEAVVPDQELIDYKEAIVMALIGVLRWREENNVLASVTGALRNSIGGAVWIGQEA